MEKHQNYSTFRCSHMTHHFRAQESGQDDPDILFLYGKALFQVAQKNSQVLGGAPASDPTFGMTHKIP
jgi:hypothetical protein